MKIKKILIPLVLVLALLGCALTSCKGNDAVIVVENGTTADGAPSVVGKWIAPDPMSTDFDELWVFEDDGTTFHLYQVTKNGYAVQNTIDGTYEIKEGGELVVSMMGYPLTYKMSFDNVNTLVLEDHGTSNTYTRYNGEIKK